MRHAGPAALAARGSSTHAGHLCGEAGLIDGHELRRFEVELAVEPVDAPLAYIGAIRLQCVRGLFLNVQPRPRSRALKALRLIRTDCSATSRSTISFSVMSLHSSVSPTMKASCVSRLEARRPYWCGASSPIFARAIQRIALDTPTPNRAAACRARYTLDRSL